MGCLQQHHGARLGLQALQRCGTFRRFGWQKASEDKPWRSGVVDSGGAQQRGDAAGTWQRDHPQTLVAQLGHQTRAGVADAGCARVADIRDALPLAQSRAHFLGSFHFVVLVHGQKLRGRLVDAVGAQQGLRVARVLTGHCVGQRQNVQGSQGDVGQIADGRSHHIQAALRIMRGTGGRLRGVQHRAVVFV